MSHEKSLFCGINHDSHNGHVQTSERILYSSRHSLEIIDLFMSNYVISSCQLFILLFLFCIFPYVILTFLAVSPLVFVNKNILILLTLNSGFHECSLMCDCPRWAFTACLLCTRLRVCVWCHSYL